MRTGGCSAWLMAVALVGGCKEEEPPVVDVDLGHGEIPDPGPGTILATTQVILLEFTPEYIAGLQRFGLTAADFEIRRTARAFVREGFEGLDVAVVIEPQELVGSLPDQIALITIRGADPNGFGFLAWNNSNFDKDVGNNVRNEVIGGFNPLLAAQGLPPHGGVFPASLFDAYDENTAPLFVDAFSATAPQIGGVEIEDFPGSRDDEGVFQLIGALGAVMASGIVPLAGGLMGLPTEEGAAFNSGDSGCYLDEPSVRTFEERARVGTTESFCSDAAGYLQMIVPPPPG